MSNVYLYRAAHAVHTNFPPPLGEVSRATGLPLRPVVARSAAVTRERKAEKAHFVFGPSHSLQSSLTSNHGKPNNNKEPI